jgi:replicative DNA helicase
MVMLIYRPEVKGKSYPGEFSHVDTKSTAMIDVAKGRNIGIMKFICKFDAPTTHFYDLQDIPISANIEPDPF